MEATEAGFRQRIATILRSNCAGIDLVVRPAEAPGELRITADHYRWVGQLFASAAKPSVELFNSSVANALYSSEADTMYVKSFAYGATGEEETTLVHEATHIIIASYPLRGVWKEYNEAYAYIAAGMYRIGMNVGAPPGGSHLMGYNAAVTLRKARTNRTSDVFMRRFAQRIASGGLYASKDGQVAKIDHAKRIAVP